jgi:hypothetical protein
MMEGIKGAFFPLKNMKGEFMEEKKEEKAPVNTGTESKLAKIFRKILGIVFILAFIFLIYKAVIHKFG